MTSNELPDRFLRPLELPGGKRLPSRILPGPMEGIMTSDFCRVMTEFDLVPIWITPFIRILDALPKRSIIKKRLAQFQPGPMVVQIMGTNRDMLVQAAAAIMTFDNVQGIEVNCACPSTRVLQSGAGSALLTSPEWIRDTLKAIRDVMPVGGLGVKVRSGLNSPDELPGILDAVRQGAPDWMVMHYRTAREMYTVIPQGWERFADVRERLNGIPLFASGDLLDVDSCMRFITTVDVDGITPARGLLKNPWLIRDLETTVRGETIDHHDAKPLLVRLIELARERDAWRPGNILDIAKFVWGEPSSEFKSLVQTKSPEHMLTALKTI